MPLENETTIDAIGIETISNKVILSIIDAWDWSDEKVHLLALQSKINWYFTFIEEKQFVDTYPAAVGRSFVIDIIVRFPLPKIAVEFVERAKEVAREINVEVRSTLLPNP